VTRRNWLLPEVPDLLGRLGAQAALTLEGADAFAAWAGGNPGAAAVVRDSERRGDEAKRELLETLRAAFVAPLEPEDLFTLSRGVDRIVTYMSDVITEAEVLDVTPDPGIGRMAAVLAEGVRELAAAIHALPSNDADAAEAAADRAIAAKHRSDEAYYTGMADLLTMDDRATRIQLRELYRRCSTISEVIVDVAERVIYAIVKET
jgi:uncharacterized protein Yka (UPF0111/DUF47 family)